METHSNNSSILPQRVRAKFGFPRRAPDHVTEELAITLLQKNTWEFMSLFDAVYSGLRSKNRALAGEEMLRLRLHERLQKFVQLGLVTKRGKEYTGVQSALSDFVETTVEFLTKHPKKQSMRKLVRNAPQ